LRRRDERQRKECARDRRALYWPDKHPFCPDEFG
jgi:hypothetical protein